MTWPSSKKIQLFFIRIEFIRITRLKFGQIQVIRIISEVHPPSASSCIGMTESYNLCTAALFS